MRLLLSAVIALAATASAQPAANPEPLQVGRTLVPGSDCPDVTSHMAGRGDSLSSDPPQPRRLGELPPADTYAAVYQLDDKGCMVPVMYRDVRALRR